jgi:hypothetical protein
MGALTVTGTTSKEGFIVEKVPPGTTTGSLKCGDCTREIEFAALADSSTVSGAQPRLLNMAAGTVDAQQGVLDEPTQLALKRFQSQHELPTSGQLDEPTAAKLRFRYGA